MDRARFAGRLVAAARRARRLHPFGILAQQRLHLAALLIAAIALPLFADDDIRFTSNITAAEFEQFSHVVAQGIFPTPVQPARPTGFLGFDVGVAGTAVSIDKNASWWQHSVGSDFSTGG